MTTMGWVISAVVILAGSMAVGLLIVNAWAAVKKARRKPKVRQVMTRLELDLAPMTESMRKASEAMRRMGQVMGRAYGVPVKDLPTKPPAILCSSCGDTLERNGNHFQCGGCGREVG